jgi:molybdopterin molybdotransferase
MGPGKAVAFGLLDRIPVFCLPGGPPSNEMAFLELALPAVLWKAGWKQLPFRTLKARMTCDLAGRMVDWTQFVPAQLSQDAQGTLWATPHRPESRLQSMALTECLIPIPEGVQGFEKGQLVEVQVLSLRPSFSGGGSQTAPTSCPTS